MVSGRGAASGQQLAFGSLRPGSRSPAVTPRRRRAQARALGPRRDAASVPRPGCRPPRAPGREAPRRLSAAQAAPGPALPPPPPPRARRPRGHRGPPAGRCARARSLRPRDARKMAGRRARGAWAPPGSGSRPGSPQSDAEQPPGWELGKREGAAAPSGAREAGGICSLCAPRPPRQGSARGPNAPVPPLPGQNLRPARGAPRPGRLTWRAADSVLRGPGGVAAGPRPDAGGRRSPRPGAAGGAGRAPQGWLRW